MIYLYMVGATALPIAPYGIKTSQCDRFGEVEPMLSIIVGDNPTADYLEEILGHAGLPFGKTQPSRLTPKPSPLCVMVGTKSLTAEERARLRWFVQNGGCLIAVGSANGLDGLFGIRTVGKLREAWLRFAQPHPIGNGLQSSLHVFGGVRVQGKSEVQVIAHAVNREGDVIGDGIILRPIGQGMAVFIAPDIVHSVAHIQQGIAVTKDGLPAPDGSAPINDGILKTEDGHVLDWERDRTVMGCGTGNAKPEPRNPKPLWTFFGQPIADELRALLLQVIFFSAQQKRLPLPMLWYWHNGLTAIGLISHDTDGNDPELGQELLSVVKGLGIATTWCILYPGGYPPSLYRSIAEAGCEIAVHYDAYTGTPLTTWSKRNLAVQHQWLKDMTGFAAFSNKNHYTRWEGRLDFYRWCEELGIRAEQSKGPSKRGTVGFLFGGSHPWRPLDDERGRPRFLEVTAINLFSQDLVSDETPPEGYFHPAIVPAKVGEWLMRQTVRMGGVAHFLFHPSHVRRFGTVKALERLVALGHEMGMEWWTSQQVADWLKQRRATQQKVHQRCDGQNSHWVWVLNAPTPLKRATLLILLSDSETTAQAKRTVYGFPFAQRIETLGASFELPLPCGVRSNFWGVT